MNKRLITLIIILTYFLHSTGISYALRPVASVESKAVVDDAVEALEMLLNVRADRNLDTSNSDKMWILVNILKELAEIKSPQPLSKNALYNIKTSIDRLLSPPLNKVIPDAILKEAEQLRLEIEQLLADVTSKKSEKALQIRPRKLRQGKTPLLRKLKEPAIIGLTLGSVIVGAGYLYLHGYYKVFREFCLPLCTTLSVFIVSLIADFLRQRIQISRGLYKKMDWKDWRHVMRYGIVCAIGHGLAIGYPWHDLSLNDSIFQQAFKIVADLAIINPLYFTPFILTTGRWLVEKRPFNLAVEDAIKSWRDTYKYALYYWSWALPVSYFVLARKSPILSIIIFNLIWVTILSFIISKEDEQEADTFKRNFKLYNIGRNIWLIGLLVALLMYPSSLFIIIGVMAVAWSFFFSYKLQRIESTKVKVTAGEVPKGSDSERFENIRARAAMLQSHLAGHFVKELQLPSAEETITEFEPVDHRRLERLATAA